MIKQLNREDKCHFIPDCSCVTLSLFSNCGKGRNKERCCYLKNLKEKKKKQQRRKRKEMKKENEEEDEEEKEEEEEEEEDDDDDDDEIQGEEAEER